MSELFKCSEDFFLLSANKRRGVMTNNTQPEGTHVWGRGGRGQVSKSHTSDGR